MPLFIDKLKAGEPLTVTDPSMTRFVMSLEEAVELVLFAFENADPGDIMIPRVPSCTIGTLAEAVQKLFGVTREIQTIGVRHGEKFHETLLTREEASRAIDHGSFFRVPMDQRDLNYEKYFSEGETVIAEEFTSDSAEILNVEQVMEKLRNLPYIQNELAQWYIQSGKHIRLTA